jgi:uncharacterized protein involved in exopolysaccharide biosynthesis
LIMNDQPNTLAPRTGDPLLVHAVLMHGRDASEPVINARRILQLLREHVILISVCALAGAAAATAGSYLFAKTYRAETVVEPVSDSADQALAGLSTRWSGVAGMLGLDVGRNALTTAASLAVLRSRQLGEQFIVEGNLLPVIFASRWDAGAKRWRARSARDVPTLQDAYERFSKRILAVQEDKRTGLVKVTVEWRDPAVAAAWANGIVSRANGLIAQDAIASADKNVEYLTSELSKTEIVGVRQAIFSLMETEIRKRMLARTRPDYAFRVLDAAKAPDEKRYVSPRRIVFLLVGAMSGAVLGMAIGTAIDRRHRRGRKGRQAP